jgi:hypothetical protein
MPLSSLPSIGYVALFKTQMKRKRIKVWTNLRRRKGKLRKR